MAQEALKPSPPQRPSKLQILLGVFIVWQLIFILVGNSFELVEEKRREIKESRETFPGQKMVRNAVQAAGALPKVWSGLTGQTQSWKMFAPFVTKQSAFMTVELRWDDSRNGGPKSVRIPSLLEPADPKSYFRPFLSFRHAKYEENLSIVSLVWDDQAIAEKPEDWERFILSNLYLKWKPMLASLRWHMLQYLRQHPQEPEPQEVVLLARIYRIPSPDKAGSSQGWEGPHEVNIARWLPQETESPEFYPVEMYNYVTEKFEKVRRQIYP